MEVKYDPNFSFSQQLWYFYETNRGKIRSRYNTLTKKILDYNDRDKNPDAFLRKPQFEALEIYVFIKEFLGNQQVYEIFDDWRNKRESFSDASYYAVDKGGQTRLFDEPTKDTTEAIFKQMQDECVSYPNYIYALTMGVGKTILMATCIFYEFLLANKYPADKRYCHNVLVCAPDKTVLHSLDEINTFDKSKVVPPEYVGLLEANIKTHYLDEPGMQLSTIDGSDFNIIITNNQKFIVKKKRSAVSPAVALFDDSLLSTVYGDLGVNEGDIKKSIFENHRFEKLCRLPQLGVYVDEAHHLFGAELNRERTTLRDTINLLAEKTTLVGCYDYTGTPYVKNQLLPEVVYAYGLRESIQKGYLKDAEPKGFENVGDEDFLRAAVKDFWIKYGGKTYGDGLNPKLAIYAPRIEKAVDEVRPALERILVDLQIPPSSILLNVGDSKYTKNEDIKNFNDLDKPGSDGNNKQFIILCEKGKEGWNCKSLFGVALYRKPKSNVFVLQATMRCLRSITDESLTASIYLSKDNYDILDKELHKNFNVEISELKREKKNNRQRYQVRVLPPPRIIHLKRIRHEYKVHKKEYSERINFNLKNADLSVYESRVYESGSLMYETKIHEKNADELKQNTQYTEFTLTGEIARYMNISCILAGRILRESADGIDKVLETVNRYNEVIYDYIVPAIFNALYQVDEEEITEDNNEVVLLHKPEDKEYYEFSAREDLVVKNTDTEFSSAEIGKTFHADTYCFDSLPEKECFLQYIRSSKVKEVYFTGMFTSKHSDLVIYYYDPESKRTRRYYPDFVAKMSDNTYQLIEVKGDNMIDNAVVQAKKEAAEEIASASEIKYIIYKGSTIMNSNILDCEYNPEQSGRNLSTELL